MPIILKDLATRNTIVKVSSFVTGSATALVPAGGETVTITGSGFSTDISVLVASTSVVVTVVNSTTLTFTSPANVAGTYTLSVTNTDGTSATKSAALLYFAPPSWTTPSGSLPGASVGIAYSTTLVATSGTITYSLTSGSLLTGLSLNSSTGVISGTVSSLSSASFTVTATNQYNQITARSFSLTAGSNPTAIDYVMVAGGGGGGIGSNWATNAGGGGGGAGGYLTGTGISVSAGVTYTITVGTGGPGAIVTGNSTAATITAATDGLDSSISGSGLSTITAKGGGGGGSYTPTNGITAGRNGGSGGGGGGAGGSQSRAGGVGVYPGSTYLNQARQGYDGGANFAQDSNGASGGGGGANQQGFAGASASGGQGGLGIVNPFAVAVGQFSSGQYYLAGGGGGSYGGQFGGPPGGLGGGAAGNSAANAVATGNNATNGTGGGGGGLAFAQSTSQAGRGGDGVIIIRYPIGFGTAATTGSVTATTDATYRYYTFTSSGTISWN